MNMCTPDITRDAVTKHPDLGGRDCVIFAAVTPILRGSFFSTGFYRLIQLLLIYLFPHMLNIELLLSLPEVVELLLAASRRSNVSFESYRLPAPITVPVTSFQTESQV